MRYVVKIGKYADYVFVFNIADDAVTFAKTVKDYCTKDIPVEIELVTIETNTEE